MKVRIQANKVSGNVNMPSSKSLFHRYLIMASESPGTKINFTDISEDVETTISCLKNLGVKIDIFENSLFIKKDRAIKNAELLLRESGSTFRFILPFSFIEDRKLTFSGQGRLPERPIGELINVLRDSSIKFSDTRLPFSAKGKIKGSHFKFSGKVSSQYISGFIMAASLMKKPVTIEITDKIQSKAYIEMTINLVREFGVNIKTDDPMTFIEIDGSNYQAPEEINIEGDWSNAWTLIGHALIRGQVEIDNLKKNSYQGDSKPLSFLITKNGNIRQKENYLLIKESKLENLSMDIDDNIDLFPVFSSLALYANSRTIFTNIKRLSYKESDRIESMKLLFDKVGCKYEVNDDEFIVYPGLKKNHEKGIELDSFLDHRIVMAISLLAYNYKYIDIRDCQAINKSYPRFFEHLQELGFDIEILET